MKANDCVTIEGGSEELILPYWGNLSDKIFVAAQRLCGRVSIMRKNGRREDVSGLPVHDFLAFPTLFTAPFLFLSPSASPTSSSVKVGPAAQISYVSVT